MGQPKDINAVGCLGLALFWCRTRGSTARGCSLPFGLTASPMCKWLRFSRWILLFVPQDEPTAQVKPPTLEEVRECNNAVKRKHPLLPNVWGAMDGLKLDLAQSVVDNGGTLHTQPYYSTGIANQLVNHQTLVVKPLDLVIFFLFQDLLMICLALPWNAFVLSKPNLLLNMELKF